MCIIMNVCYILTDTCEYLEATEDRKTFVSHESYGVSKYRKQVYVSVSNG